VTLVPLDLALCPECGAATRRTGWAQPALFRFAGYGETEHVVSIQCTRRACDWFVEIARLSLPPLTRRTA
jgi:hypothetical protein